MHYKLLLLCCTLFGGIFSLVAGQYYYFDNWTNAPLQQWCTETLSIKINTEGQQARAGRFHLILDTGHFSYSTSDVATTLRTSLFSASANAFADRSSASSPTRQVWSDHTILQIDRKNDLSNYNGNGGLYWTVVGLIPFFDVTPYTWFVAMQYLSWADTTETTLSAPWGIEIINPAHQAANITWYFYVQQAPCVNDTTAPTFSLSTPTAWTKRSHLGGVTLSLDDNVWIAGVNVPYIRTWGEWTGNARGITNQYGINFSSFKIRISGNGMSRYFTGGMISPFANNKTRQSLDKNYTVNIDSSQLFDYGVEKPITITWTVQDRNNNTVNYWPLIFNSPVSPSLIPWSASPVSWAIWREATTPVILWIADDRAGVNSWSIIVTLSWIAWTSYGPYTFSGSELNLSWSVGTANQPDYYITISNHLAFPYSGTIHVQVYATDMAGTLDNIQDYTFQTRPSCIELGCCNQVYIQTWTAPSFLYSGINITISWGFNPSFTSYGNTGILDCGTANQGMNIYRWTEITSGTATHLSFYDLPRLTLSGVNVQAVLSWNTLYLQKIYVPPTPLIPIPSWWWGWGWTISIDDCTLPSVLSCANDEWIDSSTSYYDATCCGDSHGSATGCDVSDSPYGQEITDAFTWGYNLNITNKCPITSARLDTGIIRKELAKMMTMFTIQIIGIYPDTHKVGCDVFADSGHLSDEMKFFTKTSCQLNLMGLEPDGQTPKKLFDPEWLVNRAQFGTILSRLIYGDKYNVYTGETYTWYEKHLRALYEDSIMTKIQDPFMLEKRARVLIMLERTALTNLVEEYRLTAPAHNWALSLLKNVR